MGQELIAIIGVGVALAGLMIQGQRSMARDIADLRERMARLEGLFEGFTRSNPQPYTSGGI